MRSLTKGLALGFTLCASIFLSFVMIFAAADVRCNETKCKYFNQYHPKGKGHDIRCEETKCKYFNQYHPEGKGHNIRCEEVKCKYFLQYHPEGKGHDIK